MKTRNRLILAVIAVAVLGGGGFALFKALGSGSASGGAEMVQADYYYTCPMHPSVVEEKPGDCPICGMSLVRKERVAAEAMDMSEEEHAQHLHEEGEAAQTPEGKTVYTCPMHPSVVEDKPGDCPICGMKLVPKKIEVPGSGSMSGMEMGGDVDGLVDVTVSPRQRVLANIETSPVETRTLEKEIVTVGRFDIDEQRTAHVAAWIGGRVEKLFVDFTGAEVRKGQPLLDLYSPVLIQTQEEYLSTLPAPDEGPTARNEVLKKARERLRQGARERLVLWGITDEQIAELERTRSVRTTMRISAPASGTVLKKMVQEGQYVQQGQTLFDIADLTSVWLYADVYEFEVPFLRLGQKVTVYPDAHPGEPWEGTVTFIDPVLDPRTRTVAVRATFPNPNGELKPKMIAQAVVKAPLAPSTVVPASAIINTGRRQVVWAEVAANRFSPRVVTLGPRIGDYYQVLSGLDSGLRVARSGGFLLDSESQLKAMAGGGGAHSMPGMDMSAGASKGAMDDGTGGL